MNVEVSGRHLRVFACVVQCIARLGKDVFLEASSSGVCVACILLLFIAHRVCLQLVIRTLNDSKSVFCAFYFEPGKFSWQLKQHAAHSVDGDCAVFFASYSPPSDASPLKIKFEVRVRYVGCPCCTLASTPAAVDEAISWLAPPFSITGCCLTAHAVLPSSSIQSHACTSVSYSQCAQQALRSIRSASRLSIRLSQQGSSHFLVFQSQSNSGLVKTHSFAYEDTEILQAVFDRLATPNL
jgi:hypothetical protein